MSKILWRQAPQATRGACRHSQRWHVTRRIFHLGQNGKREMVGPATTSGGGTLRWHLPPLGVAARPAACQGVLLDMARSRPVPSGRPSWYHACAPAHRGHALSRCILFQYSAQAGTIRRHPSSARLGAIHPTTPSSLLSSSTKLLTARVLVLRCVYQSKAYYQVKPGPNVFAPG